MSKPFAVQVGRRYVTFTEFAPVPQADYLQPIQAFKISLKDWQTLIANGGPEVGSASFLNFTPDQLAAHGVTTGEPT